jgi:ribose transport system ATP-binding protein
MLLAVMVIALSAYASSQSPYFFTSRNIANLLIQIAPLLIVSLGQLAVVLLGGIDLSTGPTISLTTAIASVFIIVDPPLGIAAGIVLCLGAGMAIGVVNGVLVRVLKLPDLIATLSTFSVVAGLALIVRPSPGGLIQAEFADAILLRVGFVPIAFIVALAAVILFELLLLRGRAGMRIYAVGSSEEAAYVAGIGTGFVRFAAYAFCGFMAALAGLIVTARIGSGDPQAGTNFTLLSITAVVVGGASIFGGRGTAVGTLLAAVLIMLIQNVMNQLHISAYWQYVWTGILTLVAVGIYSVQKDTRSLSALLARFGLSGTRLGLKGQER